MFKQSLTAKRIFLNAGLVMIAALLLSAGISVSAQDPDYDSQRRRALQLLDESKILEALPILEKLVKQNPRDGEVQMKLIDADLLEPYILFARPDQGIARDYVAYRKTNREKLKRYWREVVVGK